MATKKLKWTPYKQKLFLNRAKAIKAEGKRLEKDISKYVDICVSCFEDLDAGADCVIAFIKDPSCD